MAKRRLTQQQRRLIARKQGETRERAQSATNTQPGDDETSDTQDEQNGLVISHYGRYLDVENEAGELYRCTLRQNLELPVCGDRVIFRTGEEKAGVVTALMPRSNELIRSSVHRREKPAAANIDQMLVIAAPPPQFSPGLIDRYLVAAQAMQVAAIIVVNKSDLLSDTEKADVEQELAVYRRIGYIALYTHTRSEQGVSPLFSLMADKNSILVGSSGVGKTSLVNRLLPDLALTTGEVSHATGKGRHTTTATTLYHLPHGGNLIDSPGVREFALWHLPLESIVAGFLEFQPFLGQCQFNDCRHDQEPGCALRAAVDQGEITQRRFDSFHRIVNTSRIEQ